MKPTYAPTWFSDEPSYGFVARWAEMSGAFSVRRFAAGMGWDYNELVGGRICSHVAERAGLPQGAFAATPVWQTDRNLQELTWNGNVLPHYDMRGSGRWCPGCLASDGRIKGRPGEKTAHLRSWWRLLYIEVCPFHCLALQETAADGSRMAHAPLDFRRLTGTGIDVAESVEGIQMAKSVRAERYVLGRLGYCKPTGSPLLDAMPLAQALRAMDRIGAVAVGCTEARTVEGVVSRCDALSRGFELLDGDGGGFADLLVGMARLPAADRVRYGQIETFGRIYQFLNKERNDPAYQTLRDMVRKVAVDELALAPGLPFFGEKLKKREIYTVASIQPETGGSLDKIQQVAIAIGMAPAGSSRANIRFPRKQALELIGLLGRLVNYKEAMNHLGLSLSLMDSLFNAGILKPKLRAGKDGVSNYLFDTSDLDALVRKAARAHATSEEGRPGVLLTEVRSKCRVPAPTVLEAALEGRVDCTRVRSDARGLAALEFDESQTKALSVPGKRPRKAMVPGSPQDCLATLKALRGTMDLLTMSEAAAFLKVPFCTTRALVELGYIPAQPYKGGNIKHGVFRREDLDRFREEYVPAIEIAKAHGTHPRVLVPRLRLQGVHPAIEKEAVEQYFYRTTDIDAVSDLLFCFSAG